MSMGWSKKVDNGSKEYYKKSWQSKNPFISSTLPVTKGRGRKHRDAKRRSSTYGKIHRERRWRLLRGQGTDKSLFF
jgi:hypothetical protein